MAVSRTIKAALTLLATALAVFVVAANATAQSPKTLTAFFSDANPKWADMQDEVGKIITQKTGIVIKPEFAVGDNEQKVNLIVASGQYPDLISPKGAAGVLVDAGAVLELTDLINKYAPNIKKVIGDQFDRMRFNSKNPGIYFIPHNGGINQTYFDTDSFFKLQLRALKEQKFPKVQTLADYEKVIATYVKAHPTTNGQPTIGLSLLADDWRFVISVTNPSFWASGYPDDGEWAIDPTTFKAQPHLLRPEAKEYFKWLNHMNDIGLLDKESFVQKWDQYKAKIATGRVVGLIDADWEINDAVQSLKAAGNYDMTYGRFGAVLRPGIKAAYNQPTGFRGDFGIGITTACKDPIAAIKFLDFLASDEGQILNNWGILGKHYTIQNGKRVIIPAVMDQKVNDNNTFIRTTGITNYNISIRYGDGVKDATGNYYTATFPETILQTYSDIEKEVLKGYKVTYWNDLLPKASEFKPIPWGAAWAISTPKDSPLNDFWNVEQDITRKYIPMAILAKPAEFDKVWETFTAELRKATDKYSTLETELIRDRLKLWKILK